MKHIWTILFVIAIISTFAINLYLEFGHPEMTRAQLWINYWQVFVAELVVLIPLYIMSKKSLKQW